MAENSISFYSDGVNFTPEASSEIISWIITTVNNEGYACADLSFVFTTDDNLIQINLEYLNHDTYTDVITFDYTEDKIISGEIYISLERIRDNALKYSASEKDELHRVLIHSVLHLCGFTDKKSEEKAQMTLKEDYYLSLRTF